MNNVDHDDTLPYNPEDKLSMCEDIEEIDFPHLQQITSPDKSDADDAVLATPKLAKVVAKPKKSPILFNVQNCVGDQKLLQIINTENGRKISFLVDQSANKSLMDRKAKSRYIALHTFHYASLKAKYSHTYNQKIT